MGFWEVSNNQWVSWKNWQRIDTFEDIFFDWVLCFKNNHSYLGQNQFYDFWEFPSFFILRTVVEVYTYTSKIENLSIVVQTNVVWFLIWFFFVLFWFWFFFPWNFNSILKIVFWICETSTFKDFPKKLGPSLVSWV